ncbi:alpha/beta hydrolase [Konateibacter massiliensis]|uniref:alpha/beta hydrolase n=1 Tax=Konateibacter massiliensis TaxID=2002841 RepID=UPI000C14F8B0|nr:alpha/beta hydrolase [Konateibacter massiliensis]
MQAQTMMLEAKDGQKIHIYCWDEVEQPRAIVQIFHGMSEHAGRYERFAKFLNENGFLVFADDHRGHGITGETNGKFGYLGEDGFYRVVEDEYMLTEHLKEKYPKLPMFIFAHSFGSFVGQEYLTRYSAQIDGMILSGSAAQTGIMFHMAKYLAKIYGTFLGEEREAKLLDRLSFGSYNKKIENAEPASWLSRDDEQVLKYQKDSKCGFVCTANFYYHFCSGLTKLYEDDKLEQIAKNIPLFIIAGKEDPVGGYGKRVVQLEQIYRRKGLTDVELLLYEGARHELLNETNRDEVSSDVLNWLEGKLNA